MEYQVVSECNQNEIWATGFYGEAGKKRAENRINIGYWRKFMYEKDRHKILIVVPVINN